MNRIRRYGILKYVLPVAAFVLFLIGDLLIKVPIKSGYFSSTYFGLVFLPAGVVLASLLLLSIPKKSKVALWLDLLITILATGYLSIGSGLLLLASLFDNSVYNIAGTLISILAGIVLVAAYRYRVLQFRGVVQDSKYGKVIVPALFIFIAIGVVLGFILLVESIRSLGN